MAVNDKFYVLIRYDDLTSPGDYGVYDVYTLVGCAKDKKDILEFLSEKLGTPVEEGHVWLGEDEKDCVIFVDFDESAVPEEYEGTGWGIIETGFELGNNKTIGRSFYIE